MLPFLAEIDVASLQYAEDGPHAHFPRCGIKRRFNHSSSIQVRNSALQAEKKSVYANRSATQ